MNKVITEGKMSSVALTNYCCQVLSARLSIKGLEILEIFVQCHLGRYNEP